MPTANETLFDSMVSHQIGLLRYSNATVSKILALLGRVDADVVKQIIKYDVREVHGTFSRQRLEKMLVAIKNVITEAYAAIRKNAALELKSLSEYEAEFQEQAINNAVKLKLDLIMPTASELWAAVNARPFQGRLLKDWFRDLETAAFRRLRDTIRMSYTEGETIDQMVRRVRGTKSLQYKDGILHVSRRGAEALVRTAVNHTANAARNAVYEANPRVIKGVRWVSTLDGRTTLLCASRDGNVYPPDSGPRPPAHINCRSTTTPVLKSWKELGINLKEVPESTRASMDGQVPESVTFDAWLRKQSRDMQEDILGVTKATLFRAGLTLDRFVDRNGVSYTLEQLKKREAAAFEKAKVDA